MGRALNKNFFIVREVLVSIPMVMVYSLRPSGNPDVYV